MKKAKKKKPGRPKGSKTKKKKTVKKMKNVPVKNAFYVIDGTVLRNLYDLADKLDKIESQHFNHHVTDEKDDFQAWVKDVIKEMELAEHLLESKSSDTHAKVVYRHIVHKLK